MEKASRRPWTEFERTVQLREYALREFWEIFVGDRPFSCNACFKHANVQSKAIFCYAMTIMDEFYGWEDEEKRVRSKFDACMWIYTKEVLTRGQTPTPEIEEYSKRRMMSIVLFMNSFCAGTFDDHQWVSESTIAQHAEEVMGMELDHKIGIPCVVQWCMLGFSTPYKVESNIGKPR